MQCRPEESPEIINFLFKNIFLGEEGKARVAKESKIPHNLDKATSSSGQATTTFGKLFQFPMTS